MLRVYEAFAQVYDDLMRSVDYEGWARLYDALMRDAGVPPRGIVAECACGTGSLTIPLARMGYAITGLDASCDMLSIALSKARAAGARVPFVRMDMRALELHKPCDAVLATCDGVNYLLGERDVRAFFRAALRALKPGGALCFDVSTPGKLEGVLGDNTLCDFDAANAYMWRNAFDARTRVVHMELSVFRREPDGRYRRVDERQAQRAHTENELLAWLSDEGFEDARLFGERGVDAPRQDDARWHITARKPRAEHDQIGEAI